MAKDYRFLLQDLKRAEKRSQEKINPDQKLSLCMIVKNEEKYLEDALKSAQDVVDEIIIVDTGSADATVEIARRYGAKVYFKEWTDDFSAARNESIKHATGDWVLILDADERIPDDYKDNLRALLAPTDQPVCYLIYIRNFMDGMHQSSMLGHYMARLFRKTHETKFVGVVHEQFYPSWGQITIPENSFYLTHLGYTDKQVKIAKSENRNLPLVKKGLEETKDNNPDLHSFYAYYMGASLLNKTREVIEEKKEWFKKSIDFAAKPQETPHVPLAYTEYLLCCYSVGDFEEGIQMGKEAQQKLPLMKSYPDFLDIYAALLIESGKPQEAISLLHHSLALKESKSDELIFFAAQTGQAGFWRTHYTLAGAYILINDREQAQLHFEKALALHPDENKDNLLKRIEKIMGNTDVALSYVQARLDSDLPRQAYDIQLLSNIYLKREQPFEAILLQVDLHGEEKALDTAFVLGSLYLKSKRLELAKKVYQGILTLFPDSISAQLGLATAELEQSEAQPEIAKLHDYLLKCQSTEDWIAFGEFCLQFGCLDLAEKAFKVIIELDPEHYNARLYLALIYQENNQIEQAVEGLRALIATYPEQGAAYTQLANLGMLFGNFSEAELLFRHLIEKGEADWYTHYGLGVALSGQEKFDEAEASLFQAQKQAPGRLEPNGLLQLIAEAKEQATQV